MYLQSHSWVSFPALLFLGGSVVQAATIHRENVKRQSSLQTFQQFQTNLQTYAGDVNTVQTELGSSATCAASSELSTFQAQTSTFSSQLSSFQTYVGSIASCSSSMQLFYQETEQYTLELSQFQSELSTAVGAAPSSPTGPCSAYPNMQLFSQDLVQFQQEITQYSGYLSSAISAGPCGGGGPTTTSTSTSTTSTTTSTSTKTTTTTTTTTTQTTTSTSTTGPTPTGGPFNKFAHDNVAVYFGQTPITGTTSLLAQCQDPAVNIAILAFVDVYDGPNGFPTVNFGAACGGQTPEQATTAPGLLYCTQLASDISACQALGKKVFISLGGAVGQSYFASDADAQRFATTVWNLFGGGTAYDNQLRPFGGVKIDGFDVDNENNIQTGYVAFGTALRALFPTDPSKPYYLSAAPQCPFPDASDPLPLLALADFVWVQFYNNYCAVGTAAFAASLTQWSQALAAQNPSTMLLVGVLGWSAGGSGYLAPVDLAAALRQARGLGLSNFGGAMMWDGSEAHANVDPGTGRTYVAGAKLALDS